ncbi:MAG: EAL domain-containing protein [Acetatifactor sp.]|nr:EAL domain-containing protein [Acetatifactor sp.]
MRKGRKRRKAFIFGILLGILSACVLHGLPVYAAQESKPAQGETVRVVLMNYDDYGYVLMDGGEVTGYYMDYLNEIAKYTGWKYDVQVVSDSAGLYSHVQKRDYDLMVGNRYTEQFEQQSFTYPSVSMGSKQLVLAVPKTRSDLSTDDIRTLMGVRLGTTSDTTYSQELSEKFKSYCFIYGLNYVENSSLPYRDGVNLIETNSAERFEMLENGKLDGLVTTDSMALAHDLYVLDVFGEIPFYAVAPKGDTHLMAPLEEAIIAIRNVDEEFETRLHDKYFSANFKRELIFSAEEEEYLTTKRQLRIAMWDGMAPYSYLNQDGEWSGVTVEVFRKISEMTDNRVQFSFVSYPDANAAGEALLKGEVDILGQTFASVNASVYGRDSSRSFYMDYFRIYRNENSTSALNEARVAVKSDITDEMLLAFGVTDQTKVTKVNSAEEALRLVNSGKADITFVLQNVADYYINYNQFSNISELSLSNADMTLCSVYGVSVDETLRNICNKCIANIDTGELDRHITEFILQDYKEMNLFDYLRANWGVVAVVVIILLTVAIAFLSVSIIAVSNNSKRIHTMLYSDEVTGGISYRKFVEDVHHRVSEQGGKGKYYVFFANISGFKYINDRFSYNIGNRVLNVVAEELNLLSNGLPVARMYADRFVGLLPFEEQGRLEQRLNRELRAFAKQTDEEFPDFNLFLKVGICLWDLSEQTDVIPYVNYAIYAAGNLHNLSRSTYCFYTMEEHEEIQRRQAIERDMHRALEDGEFVAYYQPKFDAVRDKIIGAEALVRWQHKTKGLVSPGLFVPVFEDNRFIIEVDFCIFEQVCALLAERMEKGQKLYPISCNFSRHHFMHNTFVDRVEKIRSKYGVPAECIEIEITETVATNDFDSLLQTVNRLKEKGFKISIDDFGSGYSCIQLLYKLPIDVLKFDRVFVVEQNPNEKEEILNRSIVEVCHDNGIKVICEGVETEDQRDFVLSYGCRYIQGYLYSRPVDRPTFLQMLEG